MKTSNKILVGTGLLFLFVIIIALIVLRLMIDHGIKTEREWSSDEPIATQQAYDYQHFTELELNGPWQVEVQYGDKYSVTISVPENMRDKVQVTERDDRLYLECRRHKPYRGNLRAEITMPNLRRVESSSVAEITIRDFKTDDLSLRLSGAGKIAGYDNEIQNLDLRADGAAKIDMRWTQVTNATINANGAAHIKLNMHGGRLRGHANGAVRLELEGKVAEDNLNTTGAVSVRRRYSD